MTYNEMVKDVFSNKKMKGQSVNKLLNADFVNEEVAKKLQSIKTGEEAIQFFAKVKKLFYKIITISLIINDK